MDIQEALANIIEVEQDYNNSTEFVNEVFEEFGACIPDDNVDKLNITSKLKEIHTQINVEFTPKQDDLKARLTNVKNRLNQYLQPQQEGGASAYSQTARACSFRPKQVLAARQKAMQSSLQQYFKQQEQNQAAVKANVKSFPLTNVNENANAYYNCSELYGLQQLVSDTYDFMNERNIRVVSYIFAFYLWTCVSGQTTGGSKKTKITKKTQQNKNGKQKQVGGLDELTAYLHTLTVDEGKKTLRQSWDLAKTSLNNKLTSILNNLDKHGPSSAELEQDALTKGGKFMKKYIDALTREGAFNNEGLNIRKQELQADIEALHPNLWLIIKDFKSQPLFSQPFYLRRFVIRLILKACFGKRYKLFGDNKGFQFKAPAFLKVDVDKCVDMFRTYEDMSKNPQKHISEFKAKYLEGVSVFFEFEKQDFGKRFALYELKLLAEDKIPKGLSKLDARIYSYLHYQKSDKFILCSIDKGVKDKLNEKEKEFTGPNEEEDKKALVKRIEEIPGGKELKQKVTASVENLQKAPKKLLKVNDAKVAPSTSTSTIQQKAVAIKAFVPPPEFQKDVISFAKNCKGMIDHAFSHLLDMGHVMKDIIKWLTQFLVQVLPDPMVNFVTTFGMMYVGLIELGINILLMIVIHSYSYYNKKKIEFTAKVEQALKMRGLLVNVKTNANANDNASSIATETLNSPTTPTSPYASKGSRTIWFENPSFNAASSSPPQPSEYTDVQSLEFGNTIYEMSTIARIQEEMSFDNDDASVVPVEELVDLLDDVSDYIGEMRFDPAIVQDAQMIPGAIPAAYGGRTRRISQKDKTEIATHLQSKYSKSQLTQYARLKGYPLIKTDTKDDVISSIIKQHFKKSSTTKK